MRDWWSCVGESDFHQMAGDDRTRCGRTVTPDKHMGAAYAGLRCEMCKALVARDTRLLREENAA